MPVSVMKFLTIKSDAEYRMMCFAFGGDEEFFAKKAMSTPLGYIAGIIIGPNPALLVDTLYAHGAYAVERAGFVGNVDLEAAWEYITRYFGRLPERGVMTLEQSAGTWKVKEVKAV